MALDQKKLFQQHQKTLPSGKILLQLLGKEKVLKIEKKSLKEILNISNKKSFPKSAYKNSLIRRRRYKRQRETSELLEKINWQIVVEQCESEISALDGYINFSERIVNQSHDGQNPDPKINEVIRLVKKHFDEKPNTPF